jgi:hypothetical protein
MKPVLVALTLALAIALGLRVPHVAATIDRVPRYASFAGSWYFHGISVDVTARGAVYAVYRTYNWCGGGLRYGCDRVVDGQIIDGGIWAAFLQKPRGATVRGSIAASAAPSLAGTTVVLVRQSANFMLLKWGSGTRRLKWTLCASRVSTSSGRCGA